MMEEGNGFASLDKIKLSPKEGREAEETMIRTPDRPAEDAKSGMVTRSVKKLTTTVKGSGTGTLRSASWHAESHSRLVLMSDKLQIVKQEEASAALLTDSNLKKAEAEMPICEADISDMEEKMGEKLGRRSVIDIVDGPQRKRDTFTPDDVKKEQSPSSLEKKLEGSPRAYETGPQHLKAEDSTNCSVIEAFPKNLRTGIPKIDDKNLAPKAAVCNDIFGQENINYEREENEEEKRRRIKLSHILESSGTKPHILGAERGLTQVVDNPSQVKQVVSYEPSTDCAMIVGDGQEDRRGAKVYQPQLDVPSEGNPEAGGDACAVPGMQHVNKTNVFRHAASQCVDHSLRFREVAPETTHLHQITAQSERLPKRPGQKGELIFQADPSSVLSIKPIPTMNELGARENDTAVESLTAMPYMNPDLNLLYQPEVGVLKSKPVPKPTRGRRSRRRSPSTLTGFPEYGPFVPHPDMHYPEQARFVPGHSYQRYMMPEYAHGLSAECCDVVPGHGGGFVTAYQAEDPREVMGSGEESLSAYPANRWYYKDDFFKIPRPAYAPAPRARGRGSSRGRPRGRRGNGGVRQYLQHRLLWARYTGRSQEALDRVLSIINSKCGLQEEAPKETPQTRLWGVADNTEPSMDAASAAAAAAAAAAAVGGAAEVSDEGLYDRLDGRECAPNPPLLPYRAAEQPHAEADHYPPPCYRASAFSSNISNMMSGGSSSNASILSQSGIASNAVVDGNGYIVYLNQDDSAEFQHQPPIPFVPAEAASLTDSRGNPATIVSRSMTSGSDVKAENDVRKADDMTQSEGLSCVGVETGSMLPNKAMVDGISSDSALAEAVATGETAAVAATPQGSSLVSCVSGTYPEKDNGKKLTARKRGTPKSSGVKTPVSPVKEPKASKRHYQASGGRQKKKVRRSLTFCSPIKQEETLRATENIANALTNASPEDEASANCGGTSSTSDFLPSSSTSLPSISNLLHSSTNAGISINIHVTNDTNKTYQEQAAPRTSSEEVGAGSRMLPGTLEQNSTKSAVRPEVTSRPGEAASLVHYPVPRCTVEWHGDCHQEPGEMPLDRPPHRYQEHMMPMPPFAANTAATRFRYPYRDPNGSHGYYPQQRPFPVPGTPVDRYYTSDCAKEWSEAYTKYPTENYLTSYEMQSPSMSAPYPSVQWGGGGAGWNRNPDMFMEPYQRHLSTRAALDVEMLDVPNMRDVPYHHYHRPGSVPYSRVPAEFAEEGYSQHCPPYGTYRSASSMVSHHGKERLVAAAAVPPEGMHDGKAPEKDYDSHRLHQTWAMAGGTAGTQVVPEGPAEPLTSETSSPTLPPPQVGCSILQPENVDTSETSSQLPKEQT